MNPYEFHRGPLTFLRTLALGPDVERDPDYVAARKAAHFAPSDPVEPAEARDGEGIDRIDHKDRGELVLEFARAKYAEKVSGLDKLDAKQTHLITLTASLIAAMAATAKIAPESVGVWFQMAFTGFVAALTVLVMSRRVVTLYAPASVQSIREGIVDPCVKYPRDWLAGTFHTACESIKVYENVIQAQTNFALYFAAFGLFCLLPAVWTISPTSASVLDRRACVDPVAAAAVEGKADEAASGEAKSP